MAIRRCVARSRVFSAALLFGWPMLLALAACSAPEAEWREVKTFAGAGESKLEPFAIPDRHWRINWKTSRRGTESGPALFSLNVLNDKETSVQSVYSKIAPDSGVILLRGPGTYHLQIAGAVRYSITVETQHLIETQH